MQKRGRGPKSVRACCGEGSNERDLGYGQCTGGGDEKVCSGNDGITKDRAEFLVH